MNADTLYKAIALSVLMSEALTRGNIKAAQFIRNDLMALLVDSWLPLGLGDTAKYADAAMLAYSQGKAPDWMQPHLIGAISKTLPEMAASAGMVGELGDELKVLELELAQARLEAEKRAQV